MKKQFNQPKNPPVEKPYITPEGLQTIVLVPDGSTDLASGIPVSLDISLIYTHMPHDFVVELTAALHAQGLVKPSDYFQPGAADRYKAAVFMVIRKDFLDLQALALQELESRR